uniref:Uncharacterized protein n=1 Tax=Meloidogyne incognita TaxID=6306 RepID=A0A914MHJ8_MELIC
MSRSEKKVVSSVLSLSFPSGRKKPWHPDEIIADRLRIEEEQKQQHLLKQHKPDADFQTASIKKPPAPAPESNTEITYMSNPPVTSTCLGSSGAPQNVTSSHPHPTLTDQQQRTQYVIANNPRYAPGPMSNNFCGQKINKNTAALITDAANLNKIDKNAPKNSCCYKYTPKV